MKFLILMYHIVSVPFNDEEKLLACKPEVFCAQMHYLKNNGFNVIGLSEAIKAVKEKSSLPNRSVVITFDDGFVDVYENAYPILRNLQFPATIFIVADLIGKTNKWMYSPGSNVRRLCTWEQIEEMSRNGISIGSHTNNHLKLDQVSREEAHREIFQSKKTIESRLKISVNTFAYPYGRCTSEIQEMVAEAGYIGACSTQSGFNHIQAYTMDPYLLRRLDIFGTDRLWQFKQKVAFGTNRASISFLLRYYITRIQERFFTK